MLDLDNNWISSISSLWNPTIVLNGHGLFILFVFISHYNALFSASPVKIRLGVCLVDVGMHVSCWIGFLSGIVSMQGGDTISIKTCSSMEPCQPTMENSITQSAAGQSLLSLSEDWNIQTDLTAFTEGSARLWKKESEQHRWERESKRGGERLNKTCRMFTITD